MLKMEENITYIKLVADELVRELSAIQENIDECLKNHRGYLDYPNPHRARFNRLRIELNKKCVELENKFKNGGIV